MTVLELYKLIKDLSPNAEVFATDLYGEGTFKITGLIYNNDEVELTGEELS